MKLVELHQDRFCVLTGAPVHIVHTVIYSALVACKPEVRFWSHIDYETSENGRPLWTIKQEWPAQSEIDNLRDRDSQSRSPRGIM